MKLSLLRRVNGNREYGVYSFGSMADDYHLNSKLIQYVKPRLYSEGSNQMSAMTTIANVFAGVSIDTRFSLQMKKQDAGNAQAACLSIIGDDTDQEFRDLKNLFELFDLDITERFFTIAHFRIKPDNSASIRVLTHMEKEERSGGMFPVDLDRNSARDLLLTEGKKLMLTWEESLDPKTNLKSVCQKILNAGFFSDLEIISNQGVTCRGHKRVLKDCCSKLRAKLGARVDVIQLDLNTEGVQAFLRFLYYGSLYKAKRNDQVAGELLKAANMYGVPRLWNAVVDLLLGKRDLSVRTGCVIFKLLVDLKKLASSKVLGKHLTKAVIRKSDQDSAGAELLHAYIQELSFFNAWNSVVRELID